MSIALVLWIAIPAALATWFGGPRPARDGMPGLIDDEPEAEPADDVDSDEPAEAAEETEEEVPATSSTKDLPTPRDGAEKSDEVDA